MVFGWRRGGVASPASLPITSLSAADCHSATSQPAGGSGGGAVIVDLRESDEVEAQERLVFGADLFSELKRQEKEIIRYRSASGSMYFFFCGEEARPASGSAPRRGEAPLPPLAPPPPLPRSPPRTAPHQRHSDSAPMPTVAHLHSQS